MNRYRPILVGALLGVATALGAAYGLLVAAADAVAKQEEDQ